MEADCTAGTNGRCEYPSGNGSNTFGTCSYDQCSSDATCGPNYACVCRTADNTAPANICVEADCKSDAQCGSGVQSIDRSSCDRPVSYHCPTSSDECGADSDCTMQNFGSCAYSVMKGHFACNYSICSG